MKALNKNQLSKYLKEKNKTTVSNYKYIEIVIDTKYSEYYFLREVYGFENCVSSETWRHYHFPVSSPNNIVLSSYHEGRNTLFLVKEGKGKINLVPAIHPIAIERIEKIDNKVKVTYAGYAGGGVSASLGRGLANGVESIEIIEEGGGRKLGKGSVVLPLRKFLIIGVDDTDNEKEGATFDLVREASLKVLERFKDVEILNISECNLYPVKEKTSNCFATAVGLSYVDEELKKEKIVNIYKDIISEKSVSNEATIVIHDGFIVHGEIEEYGMRTKTEIVENKEVAISIIKKLNIEAYSFSNNSEIRRGVIGALASIGLYWKFKYTAAPPLQPFPIDATIYPNFYDSNKMIN